MNVRVLREKMVSDYNCWIELVDEEEELLYKERLNCFIEEPLKEYEDREIMYVNVWVDCEEENPDIAEVFESIYIRVHIGNDIQDDSEGITINDMGQTFESCSYGDMDSELLMAMRLGGLPEKGKIRNMYNKYYGADVGSIHFRIAPDFMIEQYIEENGPYEMGEDSEIFCFEVSPYQRRML